MVAHSGTIIVARLTSLKSSRPRIASVQSVVVLRANAGKKIKKIKRIKRRVPTGSVGKDKDAKNPCKCAGFLILS